MRTADLWHLAFHADLAFLIVTWLVFGAVLRSILR